ncbi:Uncharacterised protein [Mycobacteroides abscessus subsp. abscessus]|nr:Uncharacterised protein [Mycobacteroides abscessus subsp. abscessus]
MVGNGSFTLVKVLFSNSQIFSFVGQFVIMISTFIIMSS